MSGNSIKTKEETQQILQDSNFFNNAALSDVQVYFSGTWIHAHRYQLAKYSPWFFRAFTGAFPVATEDIIDLGDDDSLCLVTGMLRHIYGFPYQEIVLDPHDDFPQNPSTSTFNHTLSYNLEIFILADKYDVPSLRTLAVSAFMQELPNTLVDVILGDIVDRLFGIVCADRSLQEKVLEFVFKKIRFLTLHNNDFMDRLFRRELFGKKITIKDLEKTASESC
ncbi:hypothetical protein KCU78_g5411, partial [Aureobasidium melanogenum]